MTIDTTLIRECPTVTLTKEERARFLADIIERDTKRFNEEFRVEGLARYRERLEAEKNTKKGEAKTT